jgi:hypothetical protein
MIIGIAQFSLMLVINFATLVKMKTDFLKIFLLVEMCFHFIRLLTPREGKFSKEYIFLNISFSLFLNNNELDP